MPPILTPDEKQQMEAEAKKALEAANTFLNQIQGQQKRADELAKVDSGFKKFFSYYNDEIILKYDNEKRALNGDFQQNPITEADIISCATLQGGRIQPSLPQTDVIRIPEFDGGGLSIDPDNELNSIVEQNKAITTLTTGFPGTVPTGLETTSAMSPTTTVVMMKSTTTFTLSIGSEFVVSDGSEFAACKVTSFSITTAAPYVATVGYTYIMPPNGTIAIGASILSFPGFSNGERASKTASNSALQPLMDYLVQDLSNKIDIRINCLDAQISEISGNQDPEGSSEFAIAIANANASKSFLNSYKVNLDISDSGISTLNSESSIRINQVNARIIEILAAYTSRSLNYYNERYSMANNRANTARGSLRLQMDAEAGAQTSADFAATLQAQADALTSMLS